MREPEGIETPPPGNSSERPWSKDREPYVRNAEAEGSSPFTSTKGQVTGLKWDPEKVAKWPERYVSRRSGRRKRFRYFSSNLQVNGLKGARRQSQRRTIFFGTGGVCSSRISETSQVGIGP